MQIPYLKWFQHDSRDGELRRRRISKIKGFERTKSLREFRRRGFCVSVIVLRGLWGSKTGLKKSWVAPGAEMRDCVCLSLTEVNRQPRKQDKSD